MITSILFFIAAWPSTSLASRLKLKTTSRGGIHPSVQVPVVRPPVNILHPRMQLVPYTTDDMVWSDGGGFDLAYPRQEWNAGLAYSSPGWDSHVSDRRIFRQTFPPGMIYSIDSRRLLRYWADLDPALKSFSDPAYSGFTTQHHNDVRLHSQWSKLDEDKALVLDKMCDVVAEATEYLENPWGESRFGPIPLEMVGIVPKDFQLSLGVDETSVLALGAFSRVHFEDDARGSLANFLERRFARKGLQPWWAPGQKDFNVFAIEGVANSPSLPETTVQGDMVVNSAKVLLGKIEQYAHQEQEIVVLPKWAYFSEDGVDLRDYYVHLGFEMVDMDNGVQEFVYMGTGCASEDDPWVQEQQVMVGMNLWTASR